MSRAEAPGPQYKVVTGTPTIHEPFICQVSCGKEAFVPLKHHGHSKLNVHSLVDFTKLRGQARTSTGHWLGILGAVDP